MFVKCILLIRVGRKICTSMFFAYPKGGGGTGGKEKKTEQCYCFKTYICSRNTTLMLFDILYTFLLSISPLGEARMGIAYGIIKGLNPILAFFVGLVGSLLIYPLMLWLVDTFNARLWKYRPYKLQSVKLMRRTKKGIGESIKKYGFWGLMIFVMIPLPFTGAYSGAIAALLFKIDRKKAFYAISIGVFISCLLVAFGSHLGKMGVERLA